MWSGENLIYQETKTCIMKYRTDIELINGTFELIEDETIDIDSIKQLGEVSENYVAPIRENRETINKLIQVLKQHDKEIKSIKEK